MNVFFCFNKITKIVVVVVALPVFCVCFICFFKTVVLIDPAQSLFLCIEGLASLTELGSRF